MKVTTIICPKCKAEQAILRDENGLMKCAFCGEEITDLPEYVEGEGLEYADTTEEEAPKMTPVGAGIATDFILSEEEVGNALLTAGKLKKRKVIPIIEAVAFALLGASSLCTIVLGYFGVGQFVKPGFSEWFFMVIMFAMIPVVFVLPKRAKHNIVKNSTTGNELRVTVYENLAEVQIVAEDSEPWHLPLDASYDYRYENELNVILMENGQILVIPDRGAAEAQVEELHRRFRRPAEEKRNAENAKSESAEEPAEK